MPDTRAALAGFLRARRVMLKPEDLGYPHDPKRRVPGLRREEVANLAGISPEYYVRIEQGRYNQISDQVLSSLARALRLDDDGRAYLYRLAFPAPRPPVGIGAATTVGLPIRRLLEQVTETPAYVFDRNLDILLVNELTTLLSPGRCVPGQNMVLLLFSSDARARAQEVWQATARTIVAALRFHGDPDDPRMREIVGTLSIRDQDFRAIWAEHEARPLTRGIAPGFVEGFGWVPLPWQVLDVPGGNFMSVSIAAPGSVGEAAIRELSTRLRAASAENQRADAALRAEPPREMLAG
jgi:transcriptional regulator with XRE-family HTH domain